MERDQCESLKRKVRDRYGQVIVLSDVFEQTETVR